MLAAILTICGTLNGFAQQRSEDLKSIPGTWWFMAKLDNPVDTLLIIRSDLQPPMKVRTLAKNEHGMFLFYTPLTEPCNYIIFTPPSVDIDDFFSFNVHAEPGEVLSVQGCFDVNKPAYGLTFGGSRYYVDYADAFMRLNAPPQEENDEESDSVLIVIDGKMLPKSMNPQLLNHIPKRYTGEDEPKGLLQQSIAEGKLKDDLQPYFVERKQYIDSIRVLIDVNSTAKYGKPGRYGAIEITTRPFLSVSPMSPNASKARRLTHLLNLYKGEFRGFGGYSLFRKDGFIYNGGNHVFDPDLFDTPVEEHFFGQLTRQHGHSRDEGFGLVSSDAQGIFVPLVREVEIELPSSVDESHFNDVVNDIRQAARQADKSIERTDSLVRLAFIFGGKVKEGKPHRLNAFQETARNPIVKESRFYFTPDKKAASYWLAEVYFKTTGPRRLVMHLLTVDKLYASDCPAILENRCHVEGTVLDENGQPMPDALVDGNYIEPSDASGVRTDKNGHFDLWLPYHETRVRASKVGYLRGFSWPADNTPITIRLTPKTSPKSQPSLIKAVHTTKEGAVKAGDKISGTVSDDIGPLMGVSVCEIDARGHIVKSAVTDINGHFVMKVRNPENRLRFSYVGMITEKRAIDKKEYKIIMEPSMNPSFPHSTDGQSGYRYIPVDGQRRVNNKGLPIPLREGSNVTERISMADYEGLGIVEDGEGVSNENNPRVLMSLTDEEQALVMPVNDLGFDLLRMVGADENILLSPLGMTYALGLINNGAAGETRRQINKVLGCDDKGTDKFNSFCRKMLTEAPRIDRLTQMEITNEFYSHKSNKPKPIFTKVAKDDYNTQFMESDNGDPLNFSLVNTINFKGVWTDKFHKDDTQDEVFKGEDGKEQTVPMMNQTRQFFYTENDLCQTLCLPYSNEAYQMIVLLPKEGKTVQDVAQSLTADSWEKMYDQMKRITVDVKLPRFESSSEVNLTRVISALMPNAFDMKKADFSNLFDWKSYIAMIKQTGRIKVDETGTEASVVTALQGRIMGLDLAPPEVIYFHATHPFLYFIREWSTGAIFFIGQYMGS